MPHLALVTFITFMHTKLVPNITATHLLMHAFHIRSLACKKYYLPSKNEATVSLASLLNYVCMYKLKTHFTLFFYFLCSIRYSLYISNE